MGLLIVLQVLLDLGFIAIATLLLIERSKSKSAEDPRMSRGLQLLSSKIAILQDLMDRSETMGRQLSQILDNKEQEIQERMEEVERHLQRVQKATEKSHEVAKIFQDRIPHQEIIERQTTLKYLQAAKMANQGFNVDEISRQLDIPRGELDLIVKINRDRLVNEQVPAWATDLNVEGTPAPNANLAASASASPDANLIADADAAAANTAAPDERSAMIFKTGEAPRKAQSESIKPVVFKKISALDDLG